MKAFIENKIEEVGIAGIVVYVTMYGALAITAIWLAIPFLKAITGIPSFIFLTFIYLFVFVLVAFPVVAVAGIVGNVLGFTVEGIAALYRYAKRV